VYDSALGGGAILSFGVNMPHCIARHSGSHMDSRAADGGATLSFRAKMPHTSSRNSERHADDKHQAEARCLAAVQICHITAWRSNNDADIKHWVDTLSSVSVQASRATTSEIRQQSQRRKQDWRERSKPALASLMDNNAQLYISAAGWGADEHDVIESSTNATLCMRGRELLPSAQFARLSRDLSLRCEVERLSNGTRDATRSPAWLR